MFSPYDLYSIQKYRVFLVRVLFATSVPISALTWLDKLSTIWALPENSRLVLSETCHGEPRCHVVVWKDAVGGAC